MNTASRGLSFLFFAIFIFSRFCLAQEITGIHIKPFLQEVKTDIAMPEGAGRNVLKLFYDDSGVIAVTPTQVYKYSNGNWTGRQNGSDWKTAALDTNGNVWLASHKIIEQEHDGKRLKLPPMAQNDTILCLFWEDRNTLHVGTTGGLFTFNGSWTEQPEISQMRVHAIVDGMMDILWVATDGGLFRRMGGKWLNMDRRLMAPANQHTYFALETTDNGKDLLYSAPLAVGCIAEDGQHWLASGAEGLPFGPATVIRAMGEAIWYGTARGAIKKDTQWHYYNDKRWLPDNQVNDIISIDEHTVWIATPQGISQIQEVPMTMQEKSEKYLDITEKRHVRRGLVNRSVLDIPGDLSSSRTENQDNDGLWTSRYLAAECFRYAVTKNPEAREHAIRTFRALEMLQKVTGIPGLPARSFAKTMDSVEQSRSPHPKKWRPSPDGEWQWLDDTSSDEITGHIFAFALFHDLVADETLKNEAVALIKGIVDHILEHDFQLMDYDGKATRWGIWNPDSLNNNPNWIIERGVNSLQILSFLKTAHHLTANPKYEAAYRMLIERHGYAENVRQVKLSWPFEYSYAENILIFFPYYHLIKYGGGDPNLPLYLESLQRTWHIVRFEKMPVWNVMASAMLEKDCELDVAIEQLQLYPLDLVNWTMHNSHRWDLPHHPLVDRGGNGQAVHPIAPPEGNVWRWNTNPRALECGYGGTREEDGSFFLFAYWMGRYHGLFYQ